MASSVLSGPRYVIDKGQKAYPFSLSNVRGAPERLYVIGDPAALEEGLAIVGARKATPYGEHCASHFARLAAQRGIVVISGGARGCDAHAHRAALDGGGRTVVFLGGGCDDIYPRIHRSLFQEVVDRGGAVVSEHPWHTAPRRYMFRERNRLIAGLAKATLIVEAGLPSGTFSTADEALAAGKDLLVIPGSITAPSSRGCNHLIFQGATPVIDDEVFSELMVSLFGMGHGESRESGAVPELMGLEGDLMAALRASPLTLDEMVGIVRSEHDADALSWLMVWLAKMQGRGLVSKYPDGRYGAVMIC